MPRQRKTAAELKLAGTYRGDRHAKPKTAFLTGAPKRPSWLSPRAAAEWKRVVPPLAAAGIISPLDAAVVEAYCATYALWADTVEAARDAKDADEHRVLQRIAHTLCADLMKAIGELGLSPKSRQRIQPLEHPTVADASGGESILDIIRGG